MEDDAPAWVGEPHSEGTGGTFVEWWYVARKLEVDWYLCDGVGKGGTYWFVSHAVKEVIVVVG